MTTEVFDAIERKNCNNLARYPLKIGYAVGGVVDNMPIICGGDTKECYILKENSWNHLADLSVKREYHSGIVLDGSRLWITGLTD